MLKILKLLVRKPIIARSFSTSLTRQRGLVLGAYESPDGVERTELSPVGQMLDDTLGGKLREALNGLPAGIGRPGRVVTVTNVSPKFPQIAVAGLGSKDADYEEYEGNVNIRTAAGLGARALLKMGVQDIAVEGFNKPEAVAEGATLGVWYYTDKEVETKVSLFEGGDPKDWETGVIIADSQNLVRCLCETSAKYLTPRILAIRARDLLCPYGVFVYARDDTWWLKTHNFKYLLSLGASSVEPPMVLELNYCNNPIPSTKPYLLLGQGTTFNSGGLCHEKIHADMASAAIILGAFKAVAAMRLPINMRAFISLNENTLSGNAVKVCEALRFKDHIPRAENTQHHSHLLIAESFIYALKFYSPKLVIALGSECKHVDTEFVRHVRPDPNDVDVNECCFDPDLIKAIRKFLTYVNVHESNHVDYLANQLFTGTHARKLIQTMRFLYRKEQDRAAAKKERGA